MGDGAAPDRLMGEPVCLGVGVECGQCGDERLDVGSDLCACPAQGPVPGPESGGFPFNALVRIGLTKEQLHNCRAELRKVLAGVG